MCFGSDCKVCEEFYTSWYAKFKGESGLPAMYAFYYADIRDLRILCNMKNDFLLLEYMEEHKELYKMNFCYVSMAYYIADDIHSRGNEFLKLQYNSVVKFIVDHLYYSFGEPFDENNELRKHYNNLRKNEVKEKYRISPVNLRNNQSKFRKDLIYVHETCQLCGIANEELLIASHMKDYSKCSNIESCDFENGLLLCRNHDGLFDRGLISFTDKGDILISDILNEDDIEKLDIKNKKITLSKKQRDYMEWHRNNKFKKN